jgi:hypothetical protein
VQYLVCMQVIIRPTDEMRTFLILFLAPSLGWYLRTLQSAARVAVPANRTIASQKRCLDGGVWRGVSGENVKKCLTIAKATLLRDQLRC